MKRIDYDKLVRDRIPEIIAAEGRRCETRTLSADEYRGALMAKLREETAEFEESGALEELSDILEVLYALARAVGSTPDALEAVRARKARERGGFSGKIFLAYVEEEEGSGRIDR